MMYPALNDDAASATADAIRAWSDAITAWSAFATTPSPDGAMERLTAAVDASSKAHLAGVRAAVSSVGGRMEYSPFGLTGLFATTPPGATVEAAAKAPFKAAGKAAGKATATATKAAETATRRAYQALAKPLGRADDLTRIKGVGPKMQEKLNSLGVYHFWQLASLTAAAAAKIDDELAANGRVVRDAWVAQSKRLAEDVAA